MHKRIYHLTHTDVSKYSRILKELICLSKEFPSAGIYAMGVESHVGPDNFDIPTSVTVRSLRSLPRWITPRILRHFLIFCKLFICMLIELFRARPAIVHCHDTLVLPIGVVYKLFFQCRLIYDAHELESQKNGQTWLLSKITYFFEWTAWRYVDLLITVSNSINEFYQCEFGKKKAVVIFNSPLLRMNSNSSTSVDVRTEFNFLSDDKVYVYLGILSQGRGIEIALAAFERLELNNKVVFVGWGPLENTIQSSSRFGQNIFLRSAVDHDLVSSYVSTADFGLCMLEPISQSDYYALPNKLFEYAFANLPILASDFPDIKAIIERHKLGECFAPTIEGLIEKVKHLETTDFDLNQLDLADLSWQKQEDLLTLHYTDLGMNK